MSVSRSAPPLHFGQVVLTYSGTYAGFLGPRDPVLVASEDYGIDLEAEIVVVTDDVPMAATAAQAAAHIQLVGLINDVSLRNLIPNELAKGFGFFCSKPATAFSPLAVTPDELGPAWRDGRVHLRLRTTYNDQVVGDVDAGPEMHFSFFDLIAHVARTRAFTAGTILGGGMV